MFQGDSADPARQGALHAGAHPLQDGKTCIFKGWGFGKDSFAEKSVVRPTYSYLGDFIISDRVINDIVKETADRVDGVAGVIRTIPVNHDEELKITILAIFAAGYNIYETGKELQKRCSEMIENMTAFNMGNIDIEIRNIK